MANLDNDNNLIIYNFPPYDDATGLETKAQLSIVFWAVLESKNSFEFLILTDMLHLRFIWRNGKKKNFLIN